MTVTERKARGPPFDSVLGRTDGRLGSRSLGPAERTKGQASRLGRPHPSGQVASAQVSRLRAGKRMLRGTDSLSPRPPQKKTSYGGPWPSEPLRLQGSQPTLATLCSKPTRLGPGLTDISAAPGSLPLPPGRRRRMRTADPAARRASRRTTSPTIPIDRTTSRSRWGRRRAGSPGGGARPPEMSCRCPLG